MSYDSGSGTGVIGSLSSTPNHVTTTAQKLARLTELDAERAQIVSELREDFAAMRAVLPRLRKPKAPAAAKRGRPRKVKDAAADASA